MDALVVAALVCSPSLAFATDPPAMDSATFVQWLTWCGEMFLAGWTAGAVAGFLIGMWQMLFS